MAAGVLGIIKLASPHRRQEPDAGEPRVAVPPPAPPRILVFTPPTDQKNLLETNSLAVYMPTASGRAESAGFGSVRTGASGWASFHEGVDIAPVRRDAKGLPLDEVRAMADGEVAYVNRIAGNSNYGRYALIRHEEDTGHFFTLYAHMEEVFVVAGTPVSGGRRIGRMGHSPDIPVARSHVHVEICLMLNTEFERWYRARKEKPDHGNFHGRNFVSLSPLLPFILQAQGRPFRIADALKCTPVAFQLVLRTPACPNYFWDNPSLWEGPARCGGDVLLAVSESGVILRGRPATAEESAILRGKKWAVWSADASVLGRNGRRLVTRSGSGWVLGRAGQEWLEIVLYGAH